MLQGATLKFETDLCISRNLHLEIFMLFAVSPEKMPLVLPNIRKVLKPNGYLLFCDYATGDLAQWRMSSFNGECALSIQWRII
ncbi:Methyltransferase-like protein [Camellia lanceoleosa]|uniref:Methyltransferase-like protein n=1 Tax=Camellia lanceoleosa TaxID=1840588 RepID=A0ACC0HAB3_9ERIC|nr:Methyltransferase-like protein [Camellia lanceoleosa]